VIHQRRKTTTIVTPVDKLIIELIWLALNGDLPDEKSTIRIFQIEGICMVRCKQEVRTIIQFDRRLVLLIDEDRFACN